MTSLPQTIVLSDPLIVDLEIYRGDSGGFRISVKDPYGAPIDISDATWDSDIKLNENESIPMTTFDIVPVVGDTSSVDAVISPEKSSLLTSSCVYDVQMTLDTKVRTLIRGSISVTQDVSRV